MGALDGVELSDFEAHLRGDCVICEAYLRETRETLMLLHRALTPVTPPAAIKSRVLAGTRSEKVTSLEVKQPSRRRRWQVIVGTVAAGIAIAIITASVITRKYERRAAVYSPVIELLRDPATRDYPLYGAGPMPNAKGRFLWNPSGDGHILVSNLPPPPQGKMYAVWTIAHGASPRHVGRINTDAAGQGSLHIKSTANGKSVETFAVSVEPVGAVDAPTGPIVLASKPS